VFYLTFLLKYEIIKITVFYIKRIMMKKIDDAVFIVDADGVLLTAVGYGSPEEVTFRSDDPQLITRAKEAADSQAPINIVYLAPDFIAGWDTPIGLLAALVAAAPGRTYIKTAPEEAMQAIWDAAGPQDGNIVY
jgi:hypothetical protein